MTIMINIWEYEYCGKVKIIDKDGNEFIGEAQEVTDESERADDEKQEDGITISSEGKLIEFYQSEIQSIEKVCEETVKTEEYILMDDGGNGSIEGYTTEMNAASENYLKELANMGNE